MTKIDLVNNRLIPNAMEPRAAIGSYNRANDEYTLYVANQNPHVERLLMTAFVLGLPEHKVRVIAPDVGGGFGSKIFLYAGGRGADLGGQAAQLRHQVDRDRSEAFLSDAHGRDHVSHAEMAMDSQGKFLALRVHTDANLGAYLSTFSTAVPTILYATLLAGQYTTPQIYVEVDAWFTNTAPVDAYRGAGRPGSDLPAGAAGHALRLGPGAGAGRDPRAQLHQPVPLPDAGGAAVRHGRLPRALFKAKALADVKGFEQRRKASEAKGLKRGMGYSSYIEACGIAPSNIAGALGRARACSSAARSACTRPAASRCSPARTATARATRPPSRRWWPRAWASRWRTWTWCTATPAACPSAWAPTARARSASAARRS